MNNTIKVRSIDVWFFVVLTVVSIAELAVALNFKFVMPAKMPLMIVGAFFWVILTIFGWFQKSPWKAAMVTIIAAGSVLGIFIPIFTIFSLWINMVLSSVFSYVCFKDILKKMKKQ